MLVLRFAAYLIGAVLLGSLRDATLPPGRTAAEGAER